MKTALQQLYSSLRNSRPSEWVDILLTDEQRLLELEKQQIINAVDGFPLQARDLNGEDYYEEVYGNN